MDKNIDKLLTKEVDRHDTLLNEADGRARDALEAGTLAHEAFEAFTLALDMISSSKVALQRGEYSNALHFLIRSVANYYLMLGDRGVLHTSRNTENTQRNTTDTLEEVH